MFFKGVVEVLRGGVAKLKSDFRRGLLRIQQITAGEMEALPGEVPKDGSPEGFFESPVEFVFVKAHGTGDLGEAWRRVDTGIDEVAGGQYFFFVGGGLEELRLRCCPGGLFAGLRA